MKKMKNKMMKVRMDIIGLYGIPERFLFIKENHILEISWNIIDLYWKCLKMGYDIRDAKVEKKYFDYEMDPKTKKMVLVPVDEPSIRKRIDSYFRGKRADKLLRKYDYQHRDKKEKTNGTI